MSPMNNPLMMLANLARTGGNPVQMMQRMAAQDPRVAMAEKMVRGKNPKQLEQMARNMAKESDVNIEQLAQELGLM